MIAETLTFHPVADLFPSLPADEYAALVEDIRTNGLIDPIWLYEGKIVDGRHRYRACLECGVTPLFREWNGGESLAIFVTSLNIRRRHLTEDQRAMIAVGLERILVEEGKERRREAGRRNLAAYNARRRQEALVTPDLESLALPPPPPPTPTEPLPEAAERAAADFGIKKHRVSSARKVSEQNPDLAEQVRQGEIPLADAAKKVRQQEAAERAAEPKAQVLRELLPVTLAVADARALPLAEETVDLIVTSPPYGLEVPYQGITDRAEGWPVFMADWLREAYRVTKRGGRLALNVPLDTTEPVARPCYAEAVIAALAAGWCYRTTIVWNENNISKSTARGSVDSYTAPHVIARVEMIALFSKGDWGQELRGESDLTREEWLAWTDGLWTFPGQSRGWEGHPAPFPEELPRRLITLLSGRGDTVLDPFVGSGTTVVVAHRLGRTAIGYDQSATYIEAAARRVAAAL